MPFARKAPPTPRAPRRDAVRNDERVIQAAREVFGERGPQASLEDIAARAGVGVGTIYRRFPSKEALLDALTAQITQEMEAAASDALDGDDGHGLASFLEFVGESNAAKRRYWHLVAERAGDQGMTGTMADKVRALTRNAIEAGELSPDTAVEDIHLLIKALRPVVGGAADDDQPWRRFLRIHLAGMRPPHR